jgi:hypothetical protein
MVKISEPYHVLMARYRENNLNKEFIKIFQTNKNQCCVLLMGFSYLSQNSSFKSKNLVLYLKLFALQNGNIFVQIWKIRLSSYIGVPAWFSCSDSYMVVYLCHRYLTRCHVNLRDYVKTKESRWESLSMIVFLTWNRRRKVSESFTV